MVSAKALGYIVAIPDTKENLRPVKQECLPMFQRDFLPALNNSDPRVQGGKDRGRDFVRSEAFHNAFGTFEAGPMCNA